MKAAICIVGLIASAEVFGACRPMQIGEAVFEQCDREDWAVIEAPEGFVAPPMGAAIETAPYVHKPITSTYKPPVTSYSVGVRGMTITNFSNGAQAIETHIGRDTFTTYSD